MFLSYALTMPYLSNYLNGIKYARPRHTSLTYLERENASVWQGAHCMWLCACTWAPPREQPLEKSAVLQRFVYVVREEEW